MNAKEIIEQLDNGQVVVIRAADAFEFMREVERHALTTVVIKMVFVEGQCVMRNTENRLPCAT